MQVYDFTLVHMYTWGRGSKPLNEKTMDEPMLR